MISLLLTLFISLFSLGASINSIEEPKENIIYLNDNINYKGLKEYDDYAVLSSYELCNHVTFNALKAVIIDTMNAFPLDEGNTFTGGYYYNSIIFCDVNLNNLTSFNTLCYYYSETDHERIYILSYSYNESTQRYDIRSFYISSYTTGYMTFRTLHVPSYQGNPYQFPYSYYSGSLYTQNSEFEQFIKVYKKDPINADHLDNDYYKACTDLNYYDDINNAYNDGYDNGYGTGYQTGYNEGLAHADYDSTALTVFTGIVSIALTPINMFLKIFNFEILGINLTGLISGILTLAVVVIIIRLILGGKKDD